MFLHARARKINKTRATNNAITTSIKNDFFSLARLDSLFPSNGKTSSHSLCHHCCCKIKTRILCHDDGFKKASEGVVRHRGRGGSSLVLDRELKCMGRWERTSWPIDSPTNATNDYAIIIITSQCLPCQNTHLAPEIECQSATASCINGTEKQISKRRIRHSEESVSISNRTTIQENLLSVSFRCLLGLDLFINQCHGIHRYYRPLFCRYSDSSNN